MRFKPTILKLSKLGLFTFLVFCFFFSLNIPIVKAEGVGKIDDDKLNLILKELNLSSYFIDTDEERIFYTPSELKEALNQPIEPGVSSLTYGGYILIALYEKNLIKSIASREYEKKADILWNAILDINAPAQVGQIESAELLVGLIKEGGGSGLGESVLLKIPKLLEIGVALKTLKKVLYCNELRYYFNERYGGSSSNEINYTFSDNFTYKELTSSEKEYFESLWKNWGEYYTPTGVKGNIDSGAQERLQNNIVLAIKELNTQVSQPIEEKTSLSWWQKIKNLFSQLNPFSQAQVPQLIEDEEVLRSQESKEEFAEAGKKEGEASPENTTPVPPNFIFPDRPGGGHWVFCNVPNSEGTFVFKDIMMDEEGDNVKLQMELRPLGKDFTGVPNYESNWVKGYNEFPLETPPYKCIWNPDYQEYVASISVYLTEGAYHWQQRAIDEHGATSYWTKPKQELQQLPTKDTGVPINIIIVKKEIEQN